MIKQFLITIISFITINSFCAKEKFKFEDIDEKLLEDANAVVRMDEGYLEVIDKSAYTFKMSYAITILNKKADYLSQCVINYDNTSKVVFFTGKIYDKNGKIVKKLRSSDIKDYSAINDVSIFDDNRVKYAKLENNEYPYTVEFEYEFKELEALHYSPWLFYPNENVSVEKACLTVQTPMNIDIRYKEYNLNKPVKISTEEKIKIYKWEDNNLPAIEFEPYSPSHREILPWIDLEPSYLIHKDFEKKVNTWKDFSELFIELNEGKDFLPLEAKIKIQTLVSEAESDLEKVKLVYEYMQSKTRYVSIQLGIGGYQPFEASFVEEVEYGDCKALSNYTKSLLNAIGIKSYYALVRAGANRTYIDEDFPSDQFNHATLVVPLEKDTIWLECTDKTCPFGYAGSFTGNRKALVLTEHGGELWHTPIYTIDDNDQIRTARVLIDHEGNGEAKISTTYTGLQYDNSGMRKCLNQSYEDQKNWLYKEIDIPSFEIIDFNISQQKDIVPKAFDELNIKLKNYASKSGKRLFIKPNLMNSFTSIPKQLEERKYDIVKHFPFNDIDSIYYKIPEEFKVEYTPEPVSVDSDFGKYYSEIKIVNQNTFIYYRNLKMYSGRFSPDKYEDLRDFYKKIVNADKIKIVLITKQE